MWIILLHPTHRKLIRLLKIRINSNFPFVLRQSDWNAFSEISEGTMTMYSRHQKIYRILLKAVYRPIEEIDRNEKVSLIGIDFINLIEKCFFIAERKNIGITLINGYLKPIFRGIKNKRQKRNNNLEIK